MTPIEPEFSMEMPDSEEQKNIAPRETWKRPRLERLRLNLDTAFSAGSAFDGVISTTAF